MTSKVRSTSREDTIKEAWLNPSLRVGDILDLIHEEIEKEIRHSKAVKEKMTEDATGEVREHGEEEDQEEGLLAGNEVSSKSLWSPNRLSGSPLSRLERGKMITNI